jgi:hypothetical protein
MTIASWPTAHSAVEDFYGLQLAVPLDLWRAFEVRTGGSQRPHGPRRLQWLATLMLGVSALEAGLENLIISAHGHRMGRTGQASLSRDTRRYLVEDPLQAPNAQKIERLLFSTFGIELGPLPDMARFEARRKLSPNTGSGKGERVPGPTTWTDLKDFLNALVYVRNAAAHGDTAKLARVPEWAEGFLWVRKQDGTWSIQQPHALTGLRTVVAAFNTTAVALDTTLNLFVKGSPLRSADDLVNYS